MNRISIKSLEKDYGGFRLKDVTFDVPVGEVVGLIGENGAGKSSAIKSILGINKFDDGEITFDGIPISELSHRDKSRIGSVLDEISLPIDLNVTQLGKVTKNMICGWDDETYSKLCDRFALPRDRAIKEFSHGTKAKTALAVALSHHADTLILDEPTSGLDPVARDEITDILYDFMQDESHSVLISSHITSDLEKLCDRIVFIHDGSVILNEQKDEIREKYGVAHCESVERSGIPEKAIIRVRKHAYGMDILTYLPEAPRAVTERIGLEELMLFLIKGEKR